ncbi:MAG: hypothetical protein WDO74_13385 [Pseudomonadota bacterium]
MTRDQDPSRLRTLSRELPAELLLALEDAPADHATPAELAALAQRVKSALRESEGRPKRSRKFFRFPAPRGRVAAVALTFALGAAAGVAGSSVVFLAISGNSAEPPAATALSKSPPARRAAAPALPPQLSSAPEPPPDSAAILAQPPTRESAHAPVRNLGPEPATDSSSRPAAGTRDEFALLARAHAALANNPGSALALASDHERNFAHGVLVQERELVAIDALLRLGRRTEAIGRAARFHQQFPTSVHGRRIDVLLGNSEASVGDHR